MDIEIRRNRDLIFSVTCENPETLKELFQMTDDQKRTIGFDFGEPDDNGMMEVKTMYVRPKKSEYEK